MDESLDEKEKLMAQIKQLEHERDELRKDVEQLCMQQGGPSILGVANRMHFQRTASLEQEIERLKLNLASCTREKLNLEEELAEAYRVKAQLADLHAEEAAKNLEAERQATFFQGCVAAAFAERDNSIMEAEKAKENAELMSQKLSDIEKRLEELSSDCLEQRRLNDTLQADLVKLEEQTSIYEEVIDKFYEIRKSSHGGSEEMSLHDKCACLLRDPKEIWSFNDPSTSNYVAALEGELEKIKSTVDNLQSKLQMGLEIENHLKKRVHELEKKNVIAHGLILNGIVDLRHYHSQQRAHILNLLSEEASYLKSISETVEGKVRQFDSVRIPDVVPSYHDQNLDEYECRDVHISNVVESNSVQHDEPGLAKDLAQNKADGSDALAQALQEKVAALLLLSQQEERQLLERNVNAALQKKAEELQRNLLQVTNEKVKALMELSRLRQEYQSLKEGTADSGEEGKTESKERRVIAHDKEGRLKNLLKKTYINRWIGPNDSSSKEAETHLYSEADFAERKYDSVDYARIKIENAMLKERLDSMGQLTASIHRLHLALLKVKELVDCGTSCTEDIGNIIVEANLLKTALGISIPISWSADQDTESASEGNSGSEKIDAVSAAGLEMVELVILAAEALKDSANKNGS